MMTYRKRKTSK